MVSAIVSQVQAECKRTEAQCKQRRIRQHSIEATHPSLLLVGGTSPVFVEMFVTATVPSLVRKHNREAVIVRSPAYTSRDRVLGVTG